MGLGKTVQAISVAYSYRQEWPLLIVVPSSLKYPWIEEMERWIPELNPGDINLVESKSDTTWVPCYCSPAHKVIRLAGRRSCWET